MSEKDLLASYILHSSREMYIIFSKLEKQLNGGSETTL